MVEEPVRERIKKGWRWSQRKTDKKVRTQVKKLNPNTIFPILIPPPIIIPISGAEGRIPDN